jgi:hypothetical protein
LRVLALMAFDPEAQSEPTAQDGGNTTATKL